MSRLVIGSRAELSAALRAQEAPLAAAEAAARATAAATLLLNAGANVNALDNRGRSPLARAKTLAMRALLAARGGV